MSEFRLTFGQQYRREPHPTFAAAHPDGWVTIVADTFEQARELVVREFGERWSGLYDPEDQDGLELYPLGELARLEASR